MKKIKNINTPGKMGTMMKNSKATPITGTTSSKVKGKSGKKFEKTRKKVFGLK